MQFSKRITLVFALALCGAVTTAHAQDGQWINLFDGETTFGWTSMGDAKWTVGEGALTAAEGTGGIIATTSKFQDFELTAEIKVKEDCSSGLVFRGSLEGHPSENGSGVLWIREAKGSGSPWHTVHVSAQGKKVTVELDGKATDATAGTNKTGRIGLLYHHNNKASVSIKNVKLRPLGLDPLFNGKDLKGWNIIPDHKSEFAVVEGAINIKHGNGQIETAKTFRDFTMQLDIFSNGDHLNSGVFFRTPVGIFWKGYESQVRNQWEGDDRTKPVDYGTGGNYGNQASRKVVSSDRKWFTKTLVVSDNHAACWIDGYQVADYLDLRAVNEGADGKAGYVSKAGTINLQGHDPTTDLSFKNILMQDYGK